MSGELRHDNKCQNCGYTVDVAYCSNCGQKNTETRQPFHHLFTHFIEDLTHYDGAFWKTIKHLLFRPARLTKEYLSGKRQTYVPPVKLYIFISFIAFLLFSVTGIKDIEEMTSEPAIESQSKDTILKQPPSITRIMGYRSLRELDSIQKYGGAHQKLDMLEYTFTRSMLNAHEQGISFEDAVRGYLKLLPKVLFLYLPVFAFWLWLLHSKKRWYFFDHGIFTLHYFSFLLLIIFIIDSIELILAWPFGPDIAAGIYTVLFVITVFYAFFYFFRAHSRMYGEKKSISRLKSLMLFFINMLCIAITVIISALYFLYTLH